MKLLHRVRSYDDSVMKKDAVGVWGSSTIQKCTVTMRIIAYGAPGSTIDDCLRTAESTTIESVYLYSKGSGGSVWAKLFERTNEAETSHIMYRCNWFSLV
jgi:hypothetical protein